MAIDATARESNLKDSVKKYFVDNIERAEGIPVTFDKSLSTPKIQGTEVEKWVSIIFGEIDLDSISSFSVTLFCCTKKDSEGFKLAQVRDRVMGYLLDSTQTDGMARIPLYRSSATEAWALIGGMVIQLDGPESAVMEADDDSKIKTITIQIRWGTQC
jgi:hypothetical protein